MPKVPRFLNPFHWARGYFEKHPWIRRGLIVLPFLILLGFLGPALSAVESLFSLLGKILQPLLETGLGRVFLAVFVFFLIGLGIWLFAKERFLDLFRNHALAKQLDGIQLLLLGKKKEARVCFKKVAKMGRFFDLSKGPASAFGPLDIDARLKLTRIYLEDGDPKRAFQEMEHIPKSLMTRKQTFSFAELRARLYRDHPGHLSETVRQVLEESHQSWPKNGRILSLLVQELENQGEILAAVTLLEKGLSKVEGEKKDDLTKALSRMLLLLSKRSLIEGDSKAADQYCRKSLRAMESQAARLQEIDLKLLKKDTEGAISLAFSLPIPAARKRLQALLEDPNIPIGPRAILEKVPRLDVLILLAEHYLNIGELEKAGRTVALLEEERIPPFKLYALKTLYHLRKKELPLAQEDLKQALRSLGQAHGGGELLLPGEK
jgi:hypothetical protein